MRSRQDDRFDRNARALAEYTGRENVMAAERADRHDLACAARLRIVQQRSELSQLAAAVGRIRQIIAFDPERRLARRQLLEAFDGRGVRPEFEHLPKLAEAARACR